MAIVVARSRTSARPPGRVIGRGSPPRADWGALAYIGAPAGQVDRAGQLHELGWVLGGGERDAHPHETHRLLLGAAAGTGDAGDSHAYVRIERSARTVGKRLRDLFRDGAVTLDQLSRHPRQRDLRLVCIDDEPAVEVLR